MDENIMLKKRNLIHKGSILDYYCDEMIFSNGNEEKWDYIDHKPVVAIVPYDDAGNIICVNQYRHAVGEYSIEIPAGGIGENENPVEGALRELREETGYICEEGSVKPLIQMYTSIGFSNELIYIYEGKISEKLESNLDPNEFVEVIKISIEDLKHMIFNMEIKDGKTIGAIMTFISKK